MEKALSEQNPVDLELAIRRILLIHSVIMTIGGIPLLYLGDEIGTLNDYSYNDDPGKARDSRWVHRPRADWERYEKRKSPETVDGRVFGGLKRLIALRKEHAAFSGSNLELLQTENDHVLGYVRAQAGQQLVVFANFSENQQLVFGGVLKKHALMLSRRLYGQGQLSSAGDIDLKPYDFLVFEAGH